MKRFAIDSHKKYKPKLSAQIDTNLKLFLANIKHKKICKSVVGPLRTFDADLNDNTSTLTNIFVNSSTSVFSVEFQDHQCDNQIHDDFSVMLAQNR